MARPGPKPKPRELKLIQGERSDRVPAAPPALPPAPLTRPSWLLAEAKREWTRLVPLLERWGLAAIDRMALAMLCQEWARYVAAQRMIEEQGTTFTTDKGFVGVHPSVSMANRHLNNVRKLCSEFGLTLAARGRIVAPGDDGDGSPAGRLLS